MGSSLTALFGSVFSEEQVDEHSFEKFCEWRREKHQKNKNVQKATDEALMALSHWAARLSKVCLSSSQYQDTFSASYIFVSFSV